MARNVRVKFGSVSDKILAYQAGRKVNGTLKEKLEAFRNSMLKSLEERKAQEGVINLLKSKDDKWLKLQVDNIRGFLNNNTVLIPTKNEDGTERKKLTYVFQKEVEVEKEVDGKMVKVPSIEYYLDENFTQPLPENAEEPDFPSYVGARQKKSKKDVIAALDALEIV